MQQHTIPTPILRSARNRIMQSCIILIPLVLLVTQPLDYAGTVQYPNFNSIAINLRSGSIPKEPSAKEVTLLQHAKLHRTEIRKGFNGFIVQSIQSCCSDFQICSTRLEHFHCKEGFNGLDLRRCTVGEERLY